MKCPTLSSLAAWSGGVSSHQGGCYWRNALSTCI